MERQIKFRGRRLDSTDWIFGDLIQRPPFTFILSAREGAQNIGTYERHEVHPATVGQLTGLKDKNGKEIYEGDIIEVNWLDSRYKISRHLVEWNNEYCEFEFPGGCPNGDSAHFKVIGNKYQNSKLIPSSK